MGFLRASIVIAIPMCYCTHTDMNQSVGLCVTHSAATLDTEANEQVTPATSITHFFIRKIMPQKSKNI